jgi:hypothetical protein
MISAHIAAAPLYAAIQSVNKTGITVAARNISETLKALGLSEDIESVLVISTETSIDLRSHTEFGHKVLSEVGDQSELPPCPDGECEYRQDVCRWCGQVLHN